MNKFIFILVLFMFLAANISAACEEGQIDINTASLSELEKLMGIGPVKAQAIIDTRPFNSVDDLIKVFGIGEITLNNIKKQGLACVAGEKISSEENGENDEDNGTMQTLPDLFSQGHEEAYLPAKPIEFQAINLNPKDIKSEEDFGVLNKKDYALYGFIAFSILIGALFIAKRKKYKNEFR